MKTKAAKESHKRWVARNYEKYRATTNRCSRAWRLLNPDKDRIHRQTYRRNHPGRGLYYYGITEEVFRALCKAQDNKCAICGSSVEGRLSVDHDHKDGCIRGLLCRTCNLGLGLFKDNQELLIKAAGYLDRAAKKASPL